MIHAIHVLRVGTSSRSSLHPHDPTAPFSPSLCAGGAGQSWWAPDHFHRGLSVGTAPSSVAAMLSSQAAGVLAPDAAQSQPNKFNLD